MNKIKNILISVSDKTNLQLIAELAKKYDINIYSTGGSAKFLQDKGFIVKDVSELTSFSQMLGGRVKTLSPQVFSGILARRDNNEDLTQIKQHNITLFDVIIVNFYPFEQTIRETNDFTAAIENIDIGGPSMVRAAAKNHRFTTVITDVNDYKTFIDDFQKHEASNSDEFRFQMAQKAFTYVTNYDHSISNWFNSQNQQADKADDDCDFSENYQINLIKKANLRYGENPHQQAAIYKYGKGNGIVNAKQLQGKELSYNNYLDANAALQIIREFDEPSCTIVKHGNPCGVAQSDDVLYAWNRALEADPISAFGGIVSINRLVDAQLAENMTSIFLEVIIAPDFSEEALKIFSKKKNLRLLQIDTQKQKLHDSYQIRSIEGGLLLQSTNSMLWNNPWQTVSKKQLTTEEETDAEYAMRICKHVKSNAIVLVKNKQLIGLGAGQMSRVDATCHAIEKAKVHKPAALYGSTLASDAFFPFADGVKLAIEAGVSAIIQPGGSINDDKVIEAVDDANIAMVFTNTRHFLH